MLATGGSAVDYASDNHQHSKEANTWTHSLMKDVPHVGEIRRE
jgi:hypothetical protein